MSAAHTISTKRQARRLQALLAAILVQAATDVSLARAATKAFPVADVYAIVIGYNGARPGLPTLRFADDDAVRFSLLLRALGTGERTSSGAGHTGGRVWLLTDIDDETTRGLARAGLAARPDAPPTRAALAAAFAELARTLGGRPPDAAGAPGPVLYFIYAGHGLHGRILLKPEGAPEAAITGHEIRAALAEVAHGAPSLRTFLFLDACRSQSLFTDRGGDELGPDLSAQTSELERRAGALEIGVLTAATSGKPAGEVGALAAGYFSHVLASGLAGAADVDGNDIVSFGELVAFVAFNTERLTGQRPWFTPPGGDLGATAVDLRGPGARLDLTNAPPGRYVIAAATGRPVFAEAYNGGRRTLRVALSPGRYQVTQGNAGGGGVQAAVELRAGERFDLARAAWAAAPPVAVRPRGSGDPDVDDGGPNNDGADSAAIPTFASPFTPEVVATLVAGFDAGRSPATKTKTGAETAAAHSIGLGTGLGSAPLRLGGVELELFLRYRHRVGRAWFAGLRAELGRSSHESAGAYSLDRYAAWLEGGPRWSPKRSANLQLTASVALGAAALVRRAGGAATSGDPFAPAAGAGATVEVRLHATWWAFLDARYALHWFRVDSERRASGTAAVAAGISRVF